MLWCFCGHPRSSRKKYSHNCVMTAIWLATTLRHYQVCDMSSSRNIAETLKYEKKCILEFMKSGSKHFNTEVGKDTDMDNWSGEVFRREVKSTLRTEGWARVCEECDKEDSQAKFFPMTLSSSRFQGFGDWFIICAYFSKLHCFSSYFFFFFEGNSTWKSNT